MARLRFRSPFFREESAPAEAPVEGKDWGIEAKAQAAPLPQGDQLVPAQATLDQIIAAYRKGRAGILSLYALSGPGGEPALWSAALRGFDIISNVVAQAITAPNSLQIVNMKGEHQSGQDWDNYRKWLAEAPDGGRMPPYQWWADYTYDFCTGNALAHKSSGRQVLVHDRAHTATVRRLANGGLTYEVEPIDGYFGYQDKRTVPMSRMCHARWAKGSLGAGERSDLFADAPMQVLRGASEFGRTIDAYIHEQFTESGWKDKISFSKDADIYGGAGDSKEFIEAAIRWAESRGMFSWGEKVMAQYLQPLNREQMTVEMHSIAVRTTGNILGIPTPFLNEEVSAWGSGIEQMSRMFWRTSAKYKVEAILAPFSARLLPPGYRFVVDEAEYIRGDWDAASKVLTALGQYASMTGETLLDKDQALRFLGLPEDRSNTPTPPRSGLAPPPRAML